MSEHARSSPPPPTTPTPESDPALDDVMIVTDEGPPSTVQHVAASAREGATEVAGEARRQSRHLLEETREQLRQQMDQQTHHIGQALHELGGRLDALAAGRPEAAGPLDDYAEELAWRVQDVADRIDDLGLEGIIEDVQRLARRRPGTFLVAAAVAGFATARLGRGAAEAEPATPATEPVATPASPDPQPPADPVHAPPPAVEAAGTSVPPVPTPREVPEAGPGGMRR